MSLYGLYKNDELKLVGTVREIAEHENISTKTVHYYTTPTYLKRCKHGGNHKKVVKMDKDKLKLVKDIEKIEEMYFLGYNLNEAIQVVKRRNEVA